jgi:hypothetical protein
MDGSVSTGSIALAATPIKPTVRPGIAARHARDLNDIRLLKTRVLDAAQLGGDLMDFGAGNRNSAVELEQALTDPRFEFTPRERANAQAEIDSCRGLELACRDELSALSAWAELAKCSTWADLAQEAARRELIA